MKLEAIDSLAPLLFIAAARSAGLRTRRVSNPHFFPTSDNFKSQIFNLQSCFGFGL